MNKKHTSRLIDQTDIPYDTNDEVAVLSFWDQAVAHQGVEEYRDAQGRN